MTVVVAGLGARSAHQVRANGTPVGGSGSLRGTVIRVPGLAAGENQVPAVGLPASWATDALNAINAERRANGLPQYQLSADLSVVAQARVDEMIQERYIAHNDPDAENSYTQVLDKLGLVWVRAGENIILGLSGLTPRQMVDEFMASPPPPGEPPRHGLHPDRLRQRGLPRPTARRRALPRAIACRT
jgi:uncharacterized protein YkwD